MDPSRGNYFGTNNDNGGVGNNFFARYADVPNDQDIYGYHNYNTADNATMLVNGIERLSLENQTNSSNANHGGWYGSCTRTNVGNTSNMSPTSNASTWDGFWNGGPEWGAQRPITSLQGTSNQLSRVRTDWSEYGGEYDGTRYATCSTDTLSTSQLHSNEAHHMGNTRLVAEEVNEVESDEDIYSKADEEEEDNGEESEEDDNDDEAPEEEESDNGEESDEEEGIQNNESTNDVHQRDLYVIQMVLEDVDGNHPTKKQKIPYLTSANNGLEWVMSALTSANDRKCPEVFGMTKEVFGMLCHELVHTYGFHIGTKRAIGVIESLAMFITLLRGQTLKQIQEQFQRGQATCSRQINKVLNCMLKLAVDEIKPTRDANAPHPYLQAGPQYKHFKDCVGAMDGTHVFCKPRPKDANKFWGRKGGHTTNIIAICDFDLCFTFASPGWEGSMHDYKIFKECIHGKGKQKFPHPPAGKYYLVDSGYPNAKGYMAPYKGHMYHLEDFRRGGRRKLGDYEYFNRWHSSLRSVIERTFGVWKNRWRMMKIPTNYPLKEHKKYVLASMAIHNFIRRNCPEDEEFQKALHYDEYYDNNDIPDIDPSYGNMEAAEDVLFPLHANDRHMGKLRDEILMTMKLNRRRRQTSYDGNA